MMTGRDLLQLGGLVFTGVTMIVLGDTAGKTLTSAGVAPVFVAWTRFGIAALLLLPFCGLIRAELKILQDWRVWLRAAVLAAGICSILTALKSEPIANVFGAFFIGPPVAYVLAILILKERPSRVQSGLLILGFIGVMLVVKPGFGATAGMAFAVLAGMFYGCYLALTRVVAPSYRPRLLLLSQLVIGAALLTPSGVTALPPVYEGKTLALLLGSALGSAIGNYLLVVASRRAPASLIAPLIYTQLISATFIGVVIFGDWPDQIALLGLLVILISGAGSLLFTSRRKTS